MREPVMEGSGFYNAHSELQAASSAASDVILNRALQAVLVPRDRPLTLADFGCSQGHNSMRHLGRAIDVLRSRSEPEREVTVFHTDLPQNDFNSLFMLLETADDSYLRRRDRVFAFGIGRSFYKALLPDSSLLFGWSSFALNLLSRLPATAPDHIWIPSADPVTAAAARAVAAEDWSTFLRQRSRELIPGGQIVLVMGALDQTGSSGLEPLMDVANGVLLGMTHEGLLPAATYKAMTIPSRPRDRAEFEAPFNNGELPALRLEEIVIAPTPNPVLERWRATGDDSAFARDMTDFFVAPFAPGLFGADHPLEQAFAERFQRAIMASPERIARPLVTATLRITRL